jgi:hypothetical protein
VASAKGAAGLSIPGAQPPLPTPQTLKFIASVPGSRYPGKRWRTAAFFCDVGAVLFLVAAWNSVPAALGATALVVGGVSTVAGAVAVWRSWRSGQRAAAIVLLGIALVVTGVGLVAIA